MTLGVIYLTLSNVFLVWIPILIRQTMDEVQSLEENFSWFDQGVFDVLFSADAGWILFRGFLLLNVAAVAYGYLLYLTRQTLIVASRYIEFDLRNEVYDHMQKLPASYFGRTKTGDVYVRATEDIARVREYFGPGFMYGVNTITRAGILITIMFMVNRELTLWALAPLPILSVLAYWMSSFIHHRSNEIQEQYAHLAGRAQEAFSSIRLIKAYRREDYEQNRFEAESEEYRQKKLKLDIVESLFHPMLNFLIGASIVLVVWKGGLLVMEGILTVGNIAEFIIDVLYLTWPVAALGYTLNLVQRSAASNIRIQKLLSEPVMEDPASEEIDQIDLRRADIEFRGVSFKYPGSNEYALKNISIKIPSGKKIAIIGRTGSGKSTLIQLIPRLTEPTEGDILLNGKPIQSYNLLQLRNKIGFVPQDVFLFSDTIQKNIAFGKESATFEEVREAANGASILGNILEFEKKFDTYLGERGITLSGGQKQRTSIARALIRKPQILLLDDSLSAVDNKTEDAIVEYLQTQLKNTTVIQISHRLNSVRNADVIYVMHNGEIVEQGTHQELISLDTHYAALYRKQLIEKELEEL